MFPTILFLLTTFCTLSLITGARARVNFFSKISTPPTSPLALFDSSRYFETPFNSSSSTPTTDPSRNLKIALLSSGDNSSSRPAQSVFTASSSADHTYLDTTSCVKRQNQGLISHSSSEILFSLQIF